jgi:hypothetical protein
MSPDLDEASVVAWLRSKSDKSFVDIFYQAAHGRTLAPLDSPEYESHFVIAHVSKSPDAPGDWEIEFIGLPEKPDEWANGLTVAQQGEHCFQTVVSYSKRFSCPLCGGEAFGT